MERCRATVAVLAALVSRDGLTDLLTQRIPLEGVQYLVGGRPLERPALCSAAKKGDAEYRRADFDLRLIACGRDDPMLEGFSVYELTAHHEASHAVAAVTLGVEFVYVEMSVYQYRANSGENVGGLHFREDFEAMLAARDPANPADRQEIEKLAVIAIAGEAGGAFLEQRDCDMRLPSACGDYAIVMMLANWLHTDAADRNAFVERQTSRARELVSDPVCHSQIECVATLLRTVHQMSYDAVVARMEISNPGNSEAEIESEPEE